MKLSIYPVSQTQLPLLFTIIPSDGHSPSFSTTHFQFFTCIPGGQLHTLFIIMAPEGQFISMHDWSINI